MRRAILLTMSVFCLAVLDLSAQTKLFLRLLDEETILPVSNARVSLDNVVSDSVSNSSGIVWLDVAGKKRLTVTRLGYASVDMTLPEADKLTLMLRPQPFVLSRIDFGFGTIAPSSFVLGKLADTTARQFHADFTGGWKAFYSLIESRVSSQVDVDTMEDFSVNAFLRVEPDGKLTLHAIIPDTTEMTSILQSAFQSITGFKPARQGDSIVAEDFVLPIERSEPIFSVVEQQPEFPGGYEAMIDYLAKNLVFPDVAKQNGVDGAVYVQFVIGKGGAISEVKVIRGLTPECDAEAVRVITAMPKWKPGKQNGKPVIVRFVLPIRFRQGKN